MSEHRDEAKELYEKFYDIIHSQDLDGEGIDSRTMDCCRHFISSIISITETNYVGTYDVKYWTKVSEELEKL